MADTTAAAADDISGQVLEGRYQVLRPLLRSSGRTTYLAKETPGEKIRLVVVFPPEVAADEASARGFNTLVRTLRDLVQDDVARTLESGSLGDGRRFLVMEQLEGQTLRDVLAAGPLSPERAAQLLMRLSKVLTNAKVQGLWHGNLKPENILISGNAQEHVQLLELGVARLLRLRAKNAPPVLTGTPRYMSPEQAAGLPDDARSDIYALGVMTTEMLTGHPPFDGDGETLVKAHVGNPPPALKQLYPDCKASPRFEELVQRMLRKKPEERPGHSELGELIDQLPEYLEEPTAGAATKSASHSAMSFDIGAPPDGHGNTGPMDIRFGATSQVPHFSAGKKKDEKPAWMVPAAVVGGLVVVVGLYKAMSGPPEPKPVAPPSAGMPSAPSDIDVDVANVTVKKKAPPPAQPKPAPKPAPEQKAAKEPKEAPRREEPRREEPKKEEPKEQSAFATITVTSEPSGAQVFEGTLQRGTTPAKLKMPRGGPPRILLLKYEGRQETRALKVEGDETLHVKFKMQPDEEFKP